MAKTSKKKPGNSNSILQNYKQEINIPLYLILTILSCGIFNLYWNYQQMLSCNELIGRKEFDFWTWIILSLLTCGIYHIFYQYQMGSVILEIQDKQGTKKTDILPMISVLGTVLAGSIIVDVIHQYELNKLVA